MTKQAWDEFAKKEVTMAPENVLHVRVTTGEGVEVRHVVKAQWDGSLLTYPAPDPDAPVQDPDPVSDGRHKTRTAKPPDDKK